MKLALPAVTFRSLKMKFVVIFSSCLLVIVGMIVAYEIISNRKMLNFAADEANTFATETARKQLVETCRSIALEIRAEFEVALDTARTLSYVLTDTTRQQTRLDRDEVNEILRFILARNDDFLGTYTAWEPDAFDGNDALYRDTVGHDKTGRFIPYWSRSESGEIRLDPLMEYEDQSRHENGVRKGDYYLLPKERKRESVTDPFPYPIHDKIIWLVSLVSPIVVQQEFYGIAGVDMSLDFVQSLVERANTNLYSGAGRMVILAHGGILAAVSDEKDIIGQPLAQSGWEEWERLHALVEAGKESISMRNDALEVILPMPIGRTETPWGVVITLPKDVVLDQARAVVEGLRQRGEESLRGQSWLALVVLGASFLLIWIVSGQIVTPIRHSVNFAETVAKGDLTLSIQTNQNDEVGTLVNALNAMNGKLREIVAQVKQAVDNLSENSRAINARASEMAHGATEQASSTEEASASMEEMSANIKQNAENSLQTEKIALKAAQDAQNSGKAVSEAVVAMQAIAQKISIVEQIANRTHVLSMNASIEASKAQEYGKGFAVVASEVRTLAGQSESAAKEISSLVHSAVSLAEAAGQKLNSLVPDIQRTADLIQEISAASNEQSSGAAQVNLAIQQLDQVTQQSSFSAERLSGMADELANQSEQLQKTIEFFTLPAKIVDADDPEELADILGRIQHITDADARKLLAATLSNILAIPESEHNRNHASEEEKTNTLRQQHNDDGSSSESMRDDTDNEFERY